MLALLRTGRSPLMTCVQATRLVTSDGIKDKNFEVSLISKSELSVVLAALENGAVTPDEAVVIDVREKDEILGTGALSKFTEHIPLGDVMSGAFKMDRDNFEGTYGFPKPFTHSRVIFSCNSGRRSDIAARIAAEAGYEQVANYSGGAAEFFKKS